MPWIKFKLPLKTRYFTKKITGPRSTFLAYPPSHLWSRLSPAQTHTSSTHACASPSSRASSLHPTDMDPHAFKIVFVTAPDLSCARTLAHKALRLKLAACASLVPGLESHYWWNGEIQHSQEVLVIFKTCADAVPELRTALLALHPYDTPEFVVTDITQGDPRYLDWLRSHVTPNPTAL